MCKSFGYAPALEKEGTHELICFHGSQDPICNEYHANAIGRNQGQENCILQTTLNFQDNNKYIVETGKGFYTESTTAGTLEQHEDQHRRNFVCKTDLLIRRLTPVECERLMGFPDNHTQIAWGANRASDCPDGPRYKACGNSMCVNCMEWIGIRINTAEGRKP